MPLIWNFGPEILKIGSFPLRFYSVLFALGFVLGRPLFINFLKKEGIKNFKLDRLAGFMIVGTTLGARLGHVFFYQWDYFSHHLSEILLPIRFYPEFKIVGFTGLASHGAAVGIVLSLYLYTRYYFDFSLFKRKFRIKKKNEHTFLWLLDRMIICVALGGAFIRVGNFMNSEIYGTPTKSKIGVVFAEKTIRSLKNLGPFIEDVSVKKSKQERLGIYQPIDIKIKFTKNVKNNDDIAAFIEEKVHAVLSSQRDSEIRENISHNASTPITYSLKTEKKNNIATIHTLGVVRHPSQLYEALSCLVIFVLLLMYWYKKKYQPANGRMSGVFLIWVFTLRIFYENLKYADVFFQNDFITLTIPQALSIPVVITGIILFFWGNIENLLKIPNSK